MKNYKRFAFRPLFVLSLLFSRFHSWNLEVDLPHPFITIKINGFTKVVVADGVAKDGVIQAVSNVLIPPKTPGMVAEYWQGEEMTVEDAISMYAEGFDTSTRSSLDLEVKRSFTAPIVREDCR